MAGITLRTARQVVPMIYAYTDTAERNLFVAVNLHLALEVNIIIAVFALFINLSA